MGKSTENLENALKKCKSFESYYDSHEDVFIKKTLVEYLNELVKEKKVKKADLFQKAEISEIYGYQIFNGTRHTKRDNILSLSLAMGLSLEETQLILKLGGYAPLYVKAPRDCVLIYAICNKLDVVQTNALLFEYGEEALC